ncbi:MAG: hypothetical protein IH927_07425 [Proteobacteria bacterium]|nr:hypothetical protein [Pseudomonadota bacterium]
MQTYRGSVAPPTDATTRPATSDAASFCPGVLKRRTDAEEQGEERPELAVHQELNQP